MSSPKFPTLFSSYVIVNGSETLLEKRRNLKEFSSYVIVNGSETLIWVNSKPMEFSSYVIVNGSETKEHLQKN